MTKKGPAQKGQKRPHLGKLNEHVFPILTLLVTAYIVSFDRGVRGIFSFFAVLGITYVVYTFNENYAFLKEILRHKGPKISLIKQAGRGKTLKTLRFLLLVFLTLFFMACYVFIYPQKTKEDTLSSLLADRELNNTLILAAKRFVGGKKKLVNTKEEPELSYMIMKKNDRSWIEYEVSDLDSSGYTLISGLPEGEYQVKLMFYGIKLDVADRIFIDSTRGHFIELETPRYKGCLDLIVKDEENQPLANAFVTITPGETFSAARGVITGKDGKTTKCQWLYSAKYEDDYYLIDVFFPGQEGEQVLDRYKMRIFFNSEWERKKQELKIK